jgi:hypothetical protein
MFLDKLAEFLVVAITTNIVVTQPPFSGNGLLEKDATVRALRPVFRQQIGIVNKVL